MALLKLCICIGSSGFAAPIYGIIKRTCYKPIHVHLKTHNSNVHIFYFNKLSQVIYLNKTKAPKSNALTHFWFSFFKGRWWWLGGGEHSTDSFNALNCLLLLPVTSVGFDNCILSTCYKLFVFIKKTTKKQNSNVHIFYFYFNKLSQVIYLNKTNMNKYVFT